MSGVSMWLVLAVSFHAAAHLHASTGHTLTTAASADELASLQLIHEQARLYRIEQVKYRILELLGRLPQQNATQSRRVRSVSRLLLERFGLEVADPEELDAFHSDSTNSQMEEPDINRAVIERIFRFIDLVPRDKRSLIHQDAIYFEMPMQVVATKLDDAQLAVYARCPNCTRAGDVTVRLYDGRLGAPNVVLTTLRDSVDRRGTWLYLNVTELVRSWALDANKNFGVRLVMEVARGQPSVVIDKTVATVPNEQVQVPYLNMKLSNTYASRRKRDTHRVECSGLTRDGQCCSHSLVINFDDFGSSYDFVLSPRRFLANYCTGQCPPAYKPMFAAPALAHASSKVSPPPQCCAPRQMEDLRITYMGDDGVVLQSSLPGMTVRSCGCA